MSKRKEIDPEFRIWLIEECLAGRMRGREAARRAGVSSTAMRKWISLYKMDGPAAFASSNAKRTYSEESIGVQGVQTRLKRNVRFESK